MGDLDDLAAAAGGDPAPPIYAVPARTVGRMWTVNDRGNQYGPHSEAELTEMLSNGSLSQDALVWAEESQQWLPLASLVAEPIWQGVPAQITDFVSATNLIACPACSAGVSSSAASCPRCGHPFHQSGLGRGRLKPQHTGRVVAIERTGKDLKLQRVLATLLLIAGVVTIVAAVARGEGALFRVAAEFQQDGLRGILELAKNDPVMIAGIAMLCVAIPWLLLVRIATWWRHG